MYNHENISKENPLKDQIEELLQACEKNDEENGGPDSFFEDPIEEGVMTKWEEENGVEIPESYKDWLRFSRKSQINIHTAAFWGPEEFHSEYVPEDLVVIGALVGDGEMVTFSKTSKKFICWFEGQVNEEFTDFSEVLKEVISMTKGESGLSPEGEALFMEFVKRAEERERAEKGEDK